MIEDGDISQLTHVCPCVAQELFTKFCKRNYAESEQHLGEGCSRRAPRLEGVRGAFVNAWRNAGIRDKHELQKTLFPDGLVWSHEMGYLNHQNK